ncbi:MAG: hypothetical protein Fur0025_16360 [Oscillatoriaceae cyanobacterium]
MVFSPSPALLTAENCRGQNSRLKIGQVAAASGLPVKTIRYYEEIGLLEPTVARSDTGYRLFDAGVLNRLDFIKRAQSLGLSLSAIKEILEIRDRGELPCGEVKHRLLGKVEVINSQIQALEMLKSELLELLSEWEERPSTDKLAHTICPNLQADTV